MTAHYGREKLVYSYYLPKIRPFQNTGFFFSKISKTKQTKCPSTPFPEGLLFSEIAVIFPACKGVTLLPKFKILLHFANS